MTQQEKKKAGYYYLNFTAFRRCLYDTTLSLGARVLYIHLLQLSSTKGCSKTATSNTVEIYEVPTGAMLDLAPKATREDAVRKAVKRALDELKKNGYINEMYQKTKRPGCGLTINLNFNNDFLYRKAHEEITIDDEKGEANVPLNYPSYPDTSLPIVSNPSNPDQTSQIQTKPSYPEQSFLSGETEAESEEDFNKRIEESKNHSKAELPF